MLNHTLLSQLTTFLPTVKQVTSNYWQELWRDNNRQQSILVFVISAFLVSIPVFFQAPLVRVAPWLSLIFTGFWVILGLYWRSLKVACEARSLNLTPQEIAGVAYGSKARKLVADILHQLESISDTNKLEDYPDLLWRGVALASQLISPLKV